MNQVKLAVIYCRVSTQRQLSEGNGLTSQEKRCREFAKQQGYQVIEVFADKAISGAVMDRPEMKKMLSFIEDLDEVAVIIDDIKRFARDTAVHLSLRAAVKLRGGVLVSPSMKFGDEPEDEFVEIVLSGAAQLERKQNAKQVKNRMKARLMGGFWAFKNPVGYEFTKHPLHGKAMTKISNVSEVVKEALEGFASDRFLNQIEVQSFLNGNLIFREWYGKKIRLDGVGKILNNILYAGYLEKKDWGVSLTRAYHEPLISLETHQKIVDKVTGKRTFTTRNDENEDFPCRGMVLCASCGKLLTASWSKGNKKRYAFYHCKNNGGKTGDKCSLYGKSIRRDDMHNGMDELLTSLLPSANVMSLTKAIVADVHKQKVKGLVSRKKGIEVELAQVEAEQSSLLSEYVREGNKAIKDALKNEVERKQFRQEILQQQLEIASDINIDIEEDVGTLLEFISKPQKIWESGTLESKKSALSLIFGKPIPYSKKEGFGTPSMSLPYRVLGSFCASKDVMVDTNRKSSNHLIEVLQDWALIFKAREQRLAA